MRDGHQKWTRSGTGRRWRWLRAKNAGDVEREAVFLREPGMGGCSAGPGKAF